MDKESKAYARCKACNAQFYPRWNEALGQFEELCNVCLPIAEGAARDAYTEEEELDFLDQQANALGDLYKEDEYLIDFDKQVWKDYK